MMSSHSWCRRLLEGLRAAGLSDLVVSPGSRSTPLLLAAIESDLNIHSVIDERSAAFFALGRARAEEKPVAFLCTSGSAGAHALPALLEARYAEHRLVAITADRPPELHDCGANQTIDQRHLFAAACPPCLELGMPELSEEAGLAMRRRVHQAVASAPGPLHINIPFRKPLEPSREEVALRLSSPPLAKIHPATLRASSNRLEEIAARCNTAKRGLIIAGPGRGYGLELVALAKASGFVLLAGSSSGARLTGEARAERCDAFPHIVEAARQDEALAKKLAPDLILQFGAEPVSGALNRWLALQSCTRLRFRGQNPIADSHGKAELVMGEPADLCRGLSERITSPAESDFLRAWRSADEAAWAQVAKYIDQSDDALAHPLSEGRAMASILESLPSGARLTLGNSMPIRSADLVFAGHRKRLGILHQRGTSGIDGLIAGAIGSSDEAASALILGDVSCSHDIASLALAPLARGRLVIYVIDNQGGQIFSHLPIAKEALAQDSQDLWRTPPTVDFELACRAYQVPFRTAGTLATLKEAVAWSQEQSGCCLIRVAVSPSSLLDFVQRMQERPLS